MFVPCCKEFFKTIFLEDKMKEEDKKTEISLSELPMFKQTGGFLENILERSMDLIVLTDSKGNILKVNKHFLEVLGCKEDEVIGEHISKFGPKVNTAYTATTGESTCSIRLVWAPKGLEYSYYLSKRSTGYNRQGHLKPSNALEELR